MKITEDQAQRLFDAVKRLKYEGFSPKTIPTYPLITNILDAIEEIESSQPKEEMWLCETHESTYCSKNICKISKWRKVAE